MTTIMICTPPDGPLEIDVTDAQRPWDTALLDKWLSAILDDENLLKAPDDENNPDRDGFTPEQRQRVVASLQDKTFATADLDKVANCLEILFPDAEMKRRPYRPLAGSLALQPVPQILPVREPARHVALVDEPQANPAPGRTVTRSSRLSSAFSGDMRATRKNVYREGNNEE